MEKKTDWFIFVETKLNAMKISTDFYTKDEIIQEWKNAQKAVSDYLKNSDPEKFHLVKNGKWSQAQNLDHLIQSTKPMVKVFGLNKMMLMVLGKAKKPSRSYGEIRDFYLRELETANVVQGVYGPRPKEELVKEELVKEELLDFWNSVGNRFAERLEKKDEKFLDKYVVPHPLLGDLTIREILFFDIYHTYHHLEAIRKIG